MSLGAKAGIHVEHGAEALHYEAGANEEDQSERHFTRDENARPHAARGTCRGPRAPDLKRLLHIGA